MKMDDTCLFAESLCFLLGCRFARVGYLLDNLFQEAKFVTLGELEPAEGKLPAHSIEPRLMRLFTDTQGSVNEPNEFGYSLDHLEGLYHAPLFTLHVRRLAHDAIREDECRYADVRQQVSSIARGFCSHDWRFNFKYWEMLLTQSTLKSLLPLRNPTTTISICVRCVVLQSTIINVLQYVYCNWL